MPFGFIKSTQGSNGGTTSLGIAVTAVKRNYLVIVHMKFTSNVSAISVSDNATTPNTYASAIGPITSGSNNYYQYYGVATTSGATTVTTSWTTSSAVRITVEQFSGGKTTNATVFDKAASNTGTSATSSSLTLSPTAAGELISAGFISVSAVSSITAGANYLAGTNNTSLYSMYRQVGTTSETAPISWTGTSNWLEAAGAYIPAATTGNFEGFF